MIENVDKIMAMALVMMVKLQKNRIPLKDALRRNHMTLNDGINLVTQRYLEYVEKYSLKDEDYKEDIGQVVDEVIYFRDINAAIGALFDVLDANWFSEHEMAKVNIMFEFTKNDGLTYKHRLSLGCDMNKDEDEVAVECEIIPGEEVLLLGDNGDNSQDEHEEIVDTNEPQEGMKNESRGGEEKVHDDENKQVAEIIIFPGIKNHDNNGDDDPGKN